MSTFLSFVGILALVSLAKFLYDTYVKRERYESNGELLLSSDELEAFEVLKEFELERKRLIYIDKIIKRNYSINELKILQQKWSNKKFQEAKEGNIQIEETNAFMVEIWTKEYIDHVQKENSADDMANEFSKKEFENAFIKSIENGNFSDASVLITLYKNTYPEEGERLERCKKMLYLLMDGENPPKNLYYFKAEGITKVDFK